MKNLTATLILSVYYYTTACTEDLIISLQFKYGVTLTIEFEKTLYFKDQDKTFYTEVRAIYSQSKYIALLDLFIVGPQTNLELQLISTAGC